MENKNFTLTEQFARTGRLLLREGIRGFREGTNEPDAWRKRLLGLIKAKPDLTAEALVKLINHRMSAGEEVLLGLEKKGYVVLKPIEGSDDKAVELTELGHKEAALPDLDSAFSVLTEEEQLAMSGYLARVITELEKKSGPDDDDWGFGHERFAHLRGMMGAMGPARMWKLHEAFRAGCPEGDFHGGFWGMRGF